MPCSFWRQCAKLHPQNHFVAVVINDCSALLLFTLILTLLIMPPVLSKPASTDVLNCQRKHVFRQHVWVQLPLDLYKKSLDKKNTKKSGKKRQRSGKAVEEDTSIQEFYDSLTHHYTTKEGIKMVEVHRTPMIAMNFS